MKLIKLADENGYTRYSTKWIPGKTISIDPVLRKPELCTNGVLHAYTSIPLALLMAPYHACAKYTRIFELEAEIEVSDATKCGTYEAEVIRELPLPDWYIDKNKRIKVQVAFAIACAEAVLPIFEKRFPNDDRPRKAIEAAKNGNTAAGRAAAEAAGRAAAGRAAAHTAAYAVGRDAAHTAAYAASWAAWAAANADADAAVKAAAAARAADAVTDIDLDKLADDVVNSHIGN